MNQSDAAYRFAKAATLKEQKREEARQLQRKKKEEVSYVKNLVFIGIFLVFAILLALEGNWPMVSAMLVNAFFQAMAARRAWKLKQSRT